MYKTARKNFVKIQTSPGEIYLTGIADSFISKQPEESVFDCVGFTSEFLFSLAPCARAMVACSEHKF